MHKKAFVFVFFLTLLTLTYATNFDHFVYYVDLDTMYESNDPYLKTIGSLLKRWETGLSKYVENLDVSTLVLLPDDELTLNILQNISPYAYIDPAEKFEEALEFFSNSVIINSLFLFFNFQYWQNSRDPAAARIIFEYTQKIENLVGQPTPLTVYIRSQVLFKSNIYGDPEKAYNDLKEIYFKYDHDKKIIETLVEFSFLLNDTELIEELYNTYLRIGGNNPETLFFFSKMFYQLEREEESVKLANLAIENSKSAILNSQVYEFLGDIEENYERKIDFYSKSLNSNKENGQLMSKIGMAYYNWDKKENSELARYFLNAAESRGYTTEDSQTALKELRRNVVLNILFKYVIPIILAVILALWLLSYFSKKRRQKESEWIYKD